MSLPFVMALWIGLPVMRMDKLKMAIHWDQEVQIGILHRADRNLWPVWPAKLRDDVWHRVAMAHDQDHGCRMTPDRIRDRLGMLADCTGDLRRLNPELRRKWLCGLLSADFVCDDDGFYTGILESQGQGLGPRFPRLRERRIVRVVRSLCVADNHDGRELITLPISFRRTGHRSSENQHRNEPQAYCRNGQSHESSSASRTFAGKPAQPKQI
jgi:hypothetical protein